MPKMKTKKSISKRIKVTGTGKLMRFKAGRRHLLVRKNAKRRRQLRGAHVVQGKWAKTYMELISPSL